MLGTGFAAAVPVMLLFPMPMRELLAKMLNDAEPAADPSWGFIAEHYPGAIVDLLQADGGFVRDGAWYSAAYLVGGPRPAVPASRAARSRRRSTTLPEGRRGGRRRVCARGPDLQRVPARARVRADGRLRPGARPRAARGTRVAPRLVRAPGIVSTPRGA